MITGFNTDIDYNGVTYHVQTEDKGLEMPMILSLVYNRGTILASKRTFYDDLLLDFDAKVLAERLNRQHKLICAAIKAGRIEDLKKMTEKTSAVKKEEKLKAKTPVESQEIKPTTSKDSKKTEAQTEIIPTKEKIRAENLADEMPIPQLLTEELPKIPPIAEPQIIAPPPIDLPTEAEIAENWIAPIEITDADLIFDDSEDIEDILILPDEAIEILTDFDELEATKDNPLFIELLNDISFKSGETKTVSLLAGRSKSKNGVAGIDIMVKVLGSNFRPLIFHSKTDSNGVAIINLQLPQFSRGRAAILFKATSNGEEVELRRLIHPS